MRTSHLTLHASGNHLARLYQHIFEVWGSRVDNMPGPAALSFSRHAKYGEMVSSSLSEQWSLSRSLAFLAAIVAIMLGSMLPTVVAASASTGSPITLCSGDQIIVVYDAEGAPRPEKPTPMDSLKCASCILASFTALPPPPLATHPAPPPRIVVVQPILVASALPPPEPRTGLRPPPTAPPIV